MRCRLGLLLRTVRRGLAAATITMAVLAPAAAAQTPIWRPAGNPDPLRAASLPFEPAEAEPTPAGVWRAVLQTSYFNLWSRSWHTSAIHRETGRVGLPLDSDELRELERRYPDESLYFFDVGQDSQFDGAAPDYSFHFTLGATLWKPVLSARSSRSEPGPGSRAVDPRRG
jgi:hypothetical protein